MKVLDFGLAKLQTRTRRHDGETATSGRAQLTRRRGHRGHRRLHVARTGAMGEPVDPRSDIFSIGILLYEMATGERPFKGESQRVVS